MSALELGHQDGFISSDTTLNVLSVFNPRILKQFPHYYWVLVWKVQPPFLPIQVLAWFIDLNIPKCWCSRHPESQQHCLHVIKVTITCHFDQRVIGHSNTSRHIVVRLLSDRPTIINGFPKCSRRFFRESEFFVGKPAGSIYLPRISKFTGFFMCLERVPKNLLQKESNTTESFSPLYALYCCSFANHQDASSRAVFCLLTSFFLRTLLGRGNRTFVVPDLYNKDCV